MENCGGEEKRSRLEELRRPIPENGFPELVDMFLKIMIYENRELSLFKIAEIIRSHFERCFMKPDSWDGKMHTIPENPYKLVRKDRGRPQRKAPILEPFGKLRGHIWLN
jgi:hypothetical protein